MTPVRWAGAVAVMVLVLPGCADQGEKYCETLAEEQQTLTDLADDSAGGDGDVLTPTLESFQRVRDEAPEELQDEWDTLVLAYEAVVDAVDEAGIDPSDYDPDQLPEGLSREEQEQLASVASKLQSPRVFEAATGIQQHADEVCDVDFTG